MATMTVSGRLDESTKKIAEAYITKAGLSPNEVIVNIWTSIATTGTLPKEAYHTDNSSSRHQAAEAMRSVRSRSLAGTPLSSMETADIREELSKRAERAS